MRIFKFILLISLAACNTSNINKQNRFLSSSIPQGSPIAFLPELIEEGKIIHKGIFSPSYENYFYTISNEDFTNFDIKVIKKINQKWSNPKAAFFNSEYDDHGMSFSPDGQQLYFSSTRPTHHTDIPVTWHLWVVEKENGKWGAPKFVDIPNMRDKLVSHPIMTNSGRLYFHASNLDYSAMNIYVSAQVDGVFQAAKMINFEEQSPKCTPFVSPDEAYIIFAKIGSNDLKLKISFNDKNQNWSAPKAFSQTINTRGQGNPFVTEDNEYLFFTKIDTNGIWNVHWVDFPEGF